MATSLVYGRCVLTDLSWDSEEYSEKGFIAAEKEIEELVQQYDTLCLRADGDYDHVYDVYLSLKLPIVLTKANLQSLFQNKQAYDDYKQVLKKLKIKYQEPELRSVTILDT